MSEFEEVDATIAATNATIGALRAAIEAQRRQYKNRRPHAEEVSNRLERGSVSVSENIDLGECNSIDAAIEELTWLRDQVPAGAEYKLNWRGDIDGYCPDIRLTAEWKRHETDEEWQARRADVERRMAIWAERDAAQERATYEALKAKFESPTP